MSADITPQSQYTEQPVLPILEDAQSELAFNQDLAAIMPVVPEIPSSVDPERASRVRRIMKSVGGAALATVVLFEVNPFTNEPTRYGLLAASEVATRNPAVGAAVLGGSTLLMETAAVLAATKFVTGDRDNKVMKVLIDGVQKLIPKDAKMSPPIEAAAALVVGTPLVMTARQKQNSELQAPEVRKRGLITAAWVAGVCAVEGALISEGIGNLANPTTVAGVLVGLGAIVAVPKWIMKQFEKANPDMEEETVTQETVETTDRPEQDPNYSPPRYDLTPEELNELESEMVDLAKARYPAVEGFVSMWITPKNRLANFVRMNEAVHFPEVKDVSEEDEEHTLFFAVVDTRPTSNRVVHGATITGVSYKNEGEVIVDGPEQDEKSTGMYTIDSLIELGNFSAQEFYDYYHEKGIDLRKSIAVETNFWIGDRVDSFNGMRPVDLAYLACFRMVDRRDPGVTKGAMFATINHASQQSFDRVGIVHEPIMGRSDLVTPESLLGKDSLPIFLPPNLTHRELFASMGDQLPEIFV